MNKKLNNKMLFDVKIYLQKIIQPIIYKNSFKHFGKKSSIDKPLIIRNSRNIHIGNNVTIRKNIRIEMVTNYNNENYYPLLQIGDDTTIEYNCHITCASKINIGKEVLIAGYVSIVDTNHGYEDIDKSIKYNDLTSPEEVSIGDGSFIGMGARIMPGVHIGRHCVIGANSVVTKDIPDYCIAVGIPAIVVKTYDSIKNEWIKV